MHIVDLVAECSEGAEGVAQAPEAVAERWPMVQVQPDELLEVDLRDRSMEVHLVLCFYYQVLYLRDSLLLTDWCK